MPRQGVLAALVAAAAALASPAGGQGAVSWTLPERLAPLQGELPFPHLPREAAPIAHRLGLPADFLERLTDDALQLRDLQSSSTHLVSGFSGSFWQPLLKPRRFSVEQMVEVISKLDWPSGRPDDVTGAEYWVQDRTYPLSSQAGTVFYYDKDESAAAHQHTMIFPALSTVTYLSDGGAPEMVLNQTTDQFGNEEVPAIPSEGVLSYP